MEATKNILDLSQVTTEEELDQLLEKLSCDEDALKKEIEIALKSAPEMHRVYASTLASIPNFQLIENDVSRINKQVRYTAELADSVSSKVRTLDLARQRVQATTKRVDDIIDIQKCTDGIQVAMRNEEYENAAAHIHRYLKIDSAGLLDSASAGAAGVQSTSSLVRSFDVLKDAEKRLKRIVAAKFDEALTRNDTASIERFFKLFPLLYEHELGLQKYSVYIRSQISEASEARMQKLKAILKADDERTLQRDKQQATALFADIMNQLVEHVAKLIDLHQPIVETFYGPGHLLTLVKFIQQECDTQAERLLEEHERVRRLKSRSHTLDQVQRRTTASAALTTAGASGRRHHHQQSINLAIDAREIDLLLSEAALLNTRVSMYFRLIQKRCSADLENLRGSTSNDDEQIRRKQAELVQLCQQSRLAQLMQDIITSYIVMEEFFMRQTFLKAINIRTVPNIMGAEVARSRRNLPNSASTSSLQAGSSGGGGSPAGKLGKQNKIAAGTSQRSLTTQQIDDIFLILRKCIARALSSHHVDGVCAILNYSTTLLTQELAPFLLEKCDECEFLQYQSAASALISSTISSTLDISYMSIITSASGSGSTAVGGGGGAAALDEEDVIAINEFFALVNDSDACCRYVQSLFAALQHDVHAKLGNTATTAERSKLDTALNDINDLRSHFAQVLTHAFQLLRKSRLKSVLKSVLDCFAYSVKHTCSSEAEFAAYEADNPFLHAFAQSYEEIMGVYTPCLSQHNAELLVEAYCDELVEQWQRRVLKVKFSRLGAILLDKEIRAAMLYLTTATQNTGNELTGGAGISSGWVLRDKFLRLTQMANILNFDSLGEVSEYYTAPPPTTPIANRTAASETPSTSQYKWILQPVEVRTLLACRTDFSSDAIKKLKL